MGVRSTADCARITRVGGYARDCTRGCTGGLNNKPPGDPAGRELVVSKVELV